MTHEIRESWLASVFVYGSSRIHQALKEQGEPCSVHRVARLMRLAKIKAQRGYKRRYFKSGQPAHVAPNQLKQVFTVDSPVHTVGHGYNVYSHVSRLVVSYGGGGFIFA